MSPARTWRGRRRSLALAALSLALAAVVLGGTAPAEPAAAAGAADAAAAVPRDDPAATGSGSIVPITDLVPAADVRRLYNGYGTVLGVYLNGERRGRIYQNRRGGHAEELWDASGADTAVLDEASALLQQGRPAVITVVANHTPCHGNTCESILVTFAQRAAERGIPLRLAFTGAYSPTGKTETWTRFGHWIVGVTRYGAEVVVAKPQNGPLAPSAEELAEALDHLRAGGLFTPYGSTEASGPAVDALTGSGDGSGSGDDGGIDFTSLELRYLSDPGDGDGLTYAFTAEPGSGSSGSAGSADTARLQSDAFFVWLSLPRSTFWVNLRPNEPDRVVDDQLGRTDVGRILLEADLQMKRTTAQLLHPDTATGARFWSALDDGGAAETCFSFRQWIVPGPASVYEDDGGLYILDAPLKVQLESDYLDQRSMPGPLGGCPEVDPAVADRNEAMFRSQILPEVERAVNEAPEYADLRRVYLSRVGAEWYRQRSADHATAYGDLVDSGDVTPWVAHGTWTPRDVFDRYVTSYTEGEFDITRERQEGDWISTETYFYGGVDFTNLLLDRMGRTELQRSRPDLVDAVGSSLDRRSTDDAGHLWLGAAVTPAADPDAPVAPDAQQPAARPVAGPPGEPASPFDGDTVLVSLFSLGIVTCLTLMYRIIRRSRQSAI